MNSPLLFRRSRRLLALRKPSTNSIRMQPKWQRIVATTQTFFQRQLLPLTRVRCTMTQQRAQCRSTLTWRITINNRSSWPISSEKCCDRPRKFWARSKNADWMLTVVSLGLNCKIWQTRSSNSVKFQFRLSPRRSCWSKKKVVALLGSWLTRYLNVSRWLWEIRLPVRMTI